MSKGWEDVLEQLMLLIKRSDTVKIYISADLLTECVGNQLMLGGPVEPWMVAGQVKKLIADVNKRVESRLRVPEVLEDDGA